MSASKKDIVFYMVKSDILPEAIKKTAEAKELLARREAKTVNEAVKRVGLSRSAFYKYRDGIFPLHDIITGNIVTISLILGHQTGTLSRVLNLIAEARGNILTISQGIPLQGVAHVSISIETAHMEQDFSSLLSTIEILPGVLEVELVGKS